MKPMMFFFLMMCSTQTLLAQFPESDTAFYQAYLNSQDIKIVKERWKKIVSDRKAEHDKNPTDAAKLYKLSLAQFGLLSSTMRDKDEDLFDAHVDDTETNLESFISKNKNKGEARALLAAVYGLTMGYSPWKGMYLGSKSGSLMDKALKDAPRSPLVWKLYANQKFFTPETWGGDLAEAIRAYEKAIQLYETDPEMTIHNWLYLDTLAFLGQAYMKDMQSSKAIGVFEKALKIEPQFEWVKFNLLPKAKKNVASN